MFGTHAVPVRHAGGASALAPALLVLTVLATPPAARAQSAESTPKVVYVCYVPYTGLLYLIKEPQAPDACSSKGKTAHIAYDWTAGVDGHDHGNLSGLAGDDHPQYLLADGSRALTGDLAAGGFKIVGLAGGGEPGDAATYGQLQAAVATLIASGDDAGGDLGGTYPAPIVAALRGSPLSMTAPSTSGQVLQWNGGEWEPATISASVFDHGSLSGLGEDDHGHYIHVDLARTITAQHTFDPTGSPFNLGANAQGQLVTGLNADLLDGLHASDFATAAHSHSEYALATHDHTGVYAALSHAHAEYAAAADLTALDAAAVKDGDAAAGDLTGTYPDPTVAGLRGISVSASVPANGQVLAFDGSSWAPATPATGASDHGELGGLDDDDHAQYVHASLARTIAAVHTFAPVAPGSPFELGSNASGQLVAGLNADLLDGLNASAFAGAAHAHAAADLTSGVLDPARIPIDLSAKQVSGRAAALPSAGTAGRLFVDADENTLYQDDGGAWVAIAGGGTADHGTLLGLEADDHEQYVLVDGVRDATGGFAVTGSLGTGTIPVAGAGTRLMWYPSKAAFRAGEATGTQWDDAQIGDHSTAFGRGTVASGDRSFAIGLNTTASGFNSFAAGAQSQATGSSSFALGFRATTSAPDGSTKPSVFVFGDGTVSTKRPTDRDQFVVSAIGGIRLFNFHGNSLFTFEEGGSGSGCRIDGGNLNCTGTITASSDVAAKMNFESVDAETVVSRLGEISVQEWSYRADGPAVRHVGPTAQDFHAAFGLGADDRSISPLDMAGIAMLAVQALDRRTRELDARTAELESLRAEHEALRTEHAGLRDRLSRVEAALERLMARDL